METIFRGYVTRDVAEKGRVDAFGLLGERTVRFWTINVAGIEGFQASIRSVGFAWMKAFRERGGERMFIMGMQPTIRMMGSALAFATGVPVSFVASQSEIEEATHRAP